MSVEVNLVTDNRSKYRERKSRGPTRPMNAQEIWALLIWERERERERGRQKDARWMPRASRKHALPLPIVRFLVDRIVVSLPASFPSVPSCFPAKAPWHRSHRVIITQRRVTIIVISTGGSHSRWASRRARRSSIKRISDFGTPPPTNKSPPLLEDAKRGPAPA